MTAWFSLFYFLCLATALVTACEGKISSVMRSNNIRSIRTVPNVPGEGKDFQVSFLFSFLFVRTRENICRWSEIIFSNFIMIYIRNCLPLNPQIFAQKWTTQEVKGEIFSSVSVNPALQFEIWRKASTSCFGTQPLWIAGDTSAQRFIESLRDDPDRSVNIKSQWSRRCFSFCGFYKCCQCGHILKELMES